MPPLKVPPGPPLAGLAGAVVRPQMQMIIYTQMDHFAMVT